MHRTSRRVLYTIIFRSFFSIPLLLYYIIFSFHLELGDDDDDDDNDNNDEMYVPVSGTVSAIRKGHDAIMMPCYQGRTDGRTRYVWVVWHHPDTTVTVTLFQNVMWFVIQREKKASCARYAQYVPANLSLPAVVVGTVQYSTVPTQLDPNKIFRVDCLRNEWERTSGPRIQKEYRRFHKEAVLYEDIYTYHHVNVTN